jgi:hypothetical protein
MGGKTNKKKKKKRLPKPFDGISILTFNLDTFYVFVVVFEPVFYYI